MPLSAPPSPPYRPRPFPSVPVPPHARPSLPQKTSPDDETAAAAVANFECIVCYEVAVEPVVTTCGHLFCWPCLYRWLHIYDRKECPMCKGRVTEANVVPIYGKGYSGGGKKTGETPSRPRGVRPESVTQQFVSFPSRPSTSYPTPPLHQSINTTPVDLDPRSNTALPDSTLAQALVRLGASIFGLEIDPDVAFRNYSNLLLVEERFRAEMFAANPATSVTARATNILPARTDVNPRSNTAFPDKELLRDLLRLSERHVEFRDPQSIMASRCSAFERKFIWLGANLYGSDIDPAVAIGNWAELDHWDWFLQNFNGERLDAFNARHSWRAQIVAAQLPAPDLSAMIRGETAPSSATDSSIMAETHGEAPSPLLERSSVEPNVDGSLRAQRRTRSGSSASLEADCISLDSCKRRRL